MFPALTVGRAILTGSIWWGNDGSPLDVATDVASTYFIWQPLHKAALVGHAAKFAVKKSWPVAAGYIVGGVVGYGISKAIWGESGAEDFVDFWSDPTSVPSPMENIQTIGTHYAKHAFTKAAPIVARHPAHRRYRNPFYL